MPKADRPAIVFTVRMAPPSGCWKRVGPEGQVEIAGTVTDVAGRERTLAEGASGSHNLLAAVAESSLEALVVMDNHGRIRYANPAVKRLWGFTPDTLIGERVELLIPEGQHRDQHAGYVQEYLRTGDSEIMERGRIIEIEHVDGSRRPAYIRVHRTDLGGEPFFTAVIHSLAEDTALAAQLQEKDRRLEEERDLLVQVTGTLPIRMKYFDQDGTYVFVNRAVEQAWGRPLEQFVGRHYSEVLMPPLLEKAHAAFERALAGEEVRFAAPLVEQGELRHFISSYTPHTTTDGTVVGVIVAATDVTDLRIAQHSLEEARVFAEAANAAKSRFVIKVCHEIRGPVGAILGLSQLLEDQAGSGQLSAAVGEYLKYLSASAGALARLVEDVSDLGRTELGRIPVVMRSFRLSDLFEDLRATMYVRTLRRRMSLEITAAPDVPELIVSDRTRIYQVLLNLLGNAEKYSPDGTTVELHVLREDLRLMFHVLDEGPGIPADFEAQLFEPFSRSSGTAHTVKGSGLGLAIARENARALGGDLTYERNLGTHGAFQFTASLVEAREPAAAVRKRRDLDLRGLRVLVVEDNSVNRAVDRALLESMGLLVTAVESGEAALAIARLVDPQLLLLDYHLPGLSGLDTLRALRERFPGLQSVPALIVTGDPFGKELGGLIGSELAGVIPKPCRRADLELQLLRLFPERAG